MILSRVVTLFIARFWQMVWIHFIYTVLGLAIFTPILGVIGHFLLGFSGESVLSDMDILFFVLSPAGMLVVIIFAALLITILAFEQASLMLLVLGEMHGRHFGIGQALYFAGGNTHRIFRFALRLIVRVLIIVLPFLAVGVLIVWLLISEYDINYYLSAKPPVFYLTLALNGVVVLAMLYLLIRKLLAWSLALPLVLFSNIAPVRSFGESERIVSGQRREVLRSITIWAVAIILLGVLLLAMVEMAGYWIAPQFYDQIQLLIVVIGLFLALLSLGHFFISAFAGGTFAGLVMLLADRYGALLQVDMLSRQATGSGRGFGTKKKLLLLFIAAAVSIGMGVWLINDIPADKKVEIIAHRGAAGKAPENTMAAFRQAIEDGADWIELDVQETVDGRVLVVHDSDFMKLAKVPTKIWDGTLEELQQIDIGSWFDPQFSDAYPPTLEEVLRMARGRAKVMIELKYYGRDQKLEERVLRVIEQTGMVGSVSVMSLSPAGVKKFRALRPEIPAGVLLTKAIGDISVMDVDFLAVNQALIVPGFIRRTHQVGKKLYVWTVDDPLGVARMVSLGVDGIITNEPEMAGGIVREMQKLDTLERLLIHTAALFGSSVPRHVYRDDSP